MNENAKMVLLASALLVMTGIVMIYSSSAVYADSFCHDSAYYVKRHLVFFVIGLIGAVFCMAMPPGFFRDNARWIMLFALVLLAVVLIPGIGSLGGGARRWIRFGPLNFQPSEMAKLAVILYVADFTSRKRYLITNLWKGFIPPFLVISASSALVLLEPDLGTSISIAFIGITMLFVAGAKVRHLFFIAASAVPALVFAVLSAPYRVKRVVTFLKPWEDPQGSGFQLIQSFIALGSGGLFGVGLGESKQKLFYLPQSHTDFIYSIIGEELGILGTTAILSLFAVLIWYTLKISIRIKDLFMSRVVFGVALMIAFEAAVNIGVSTGALPTKGLPLPFISYGGSSLVFHLIAIGLVLNMSKGVE